jgi:hypothetical protein
MQVMTQSLAGTERDEEAKTLFQKLNLLDPYSAFATLQNPSSDRVPDKALTIEKLEWKPGQTGTGELDQPTWATSLGVDLGELSSEDQEAIPEWLSGEAPIEPEPEEQKSSVPAFSPDSLPDLFPSEDEGDQIESDKKQTHVDMPEEEIPDWMKAAGWIPSTGEGEVTEASVSFEQSQPHSDTLQSEQPDDSEISPAEIPEWLQAMAPEDEPEEFSQDEEDVSPWLENLLADDVPQATPSTSDKIQDEPETQSPQSEQEDETAIPDWLKTGAAAGAGVAAAGLAGVFDEETREPEESGLEDFVSVGESASDMPEQLKENGDDNSTSTEEKEEMETESEITDGLEASAVTGIGKYEADQDLRSTEVQINEQTDDQALPEWLSRDEESTVGLPDWLSESDETPSSEIPAELEPASE